MTGSKNRRRAGILRNLWGFQPLARAVMVVSAVAVLATGVTYAALQSQGVSLTGNTISTASADLRIGTSASTFDTSRTGFKYTNVVPGSAPSPTEGPSFYLKNYGGSEMALKVAIGTTPVNTASVDLSKVYLIFTRVDSSSVQKISLASMIAANTSGGVQMTDILGAGLTGQFKVQVAMDDDAYSGVSAAISGIDLVFTGTVVTHP